MLQPGAAHQQLKIVLCFQVLNYLANYRRDAPSRRGGWLADIGQMVQISGTRKIRKYKEANIDPKVNLRQASNVQRRKGGGSTL